MIEGWRLSMKEAPAPPRAKPPHAIVSRCGRTPTITLPLLIKWRPNETPNRQRMTLRRCSCSCVIMNYADHSNSGERSFLTAAHRPWPVPNRSWAMRMRWCDLLFAHWNADAAVLRRLIPEGLELDLFEGSAYVGVVPFRMEGVTPRWVPASPGFDAFPELNLRTYVKAAGKPGVWFFSLDAGQRLAVRVARRFFHLPYFDAKFEINEVDDGIEYSALRIHRGAPSAAFVAKYRPLGAVYVSAMGTLEWWLTERYCLYSVDRAGRLYRGEIDHEPWPLQQAAAEVQVNTLGDWLGIETKGQPTLHFAKSLDVRAWLIERV